MIQELGMGGMKIFIQNKGLKILGDLKFSVRYLNAKHSNDKKGSRYNSH